MQRGVVRIFSSFFLIFHLRVRWSVWNETGRVKGGIWWREKRRGKREHNTRGAFMAYQVGSWETLERRDFFIAAS